MCTSQRNAMRRMHRTVLSVNHLQRKDCLSPQWNVIPKNRLQSEACHSCRLATVASEDNRKFPFYACAQVENHGGDALSPELITQVVRIRQVVRVRLRTEKKRSACGLKGWRGGQRGETRSEQRH